MSTKRSCLNLYDKETFSSVFEISNHLAEVKVSSAAPVYVEPTLKLGHSAGDIPDVAQKLYDIDATFVTVNSTIDDKSIEFQNSLDSTALAINTTVGVLQSALTTETAQRAAGQSADAVARVALGDSLQTALNTEIHTARAKETENTDAINDLSVALNSSIASEISARSVAVANIQSQIDFVKSNVDTAAIDSISELLAKFQADDGSLLSIITSLQAEVNTLKAVVDTLTLCEDDHEHSHSHSDSDSD